MGTATFPVSDESFEDTRVKAVEARPGGGWSIERADGWSFFVPADSPVEPKPGMHARFYGGGIGRPVRGLFLAGERVFYETEAEYRDRVRREQDEADRERRFDYERGRAENDRRIVALPEPYRVRIAAFRRHNPDWGWNHEGYELFGCEQGVVIAAAITADRSEEGVRLFFESFRDLSWEDQKKLIPDLSDGHSGNTFGFACRMAQVQILRPDLIPFEHGALCPLVGCKDYGCHAARSKKGVA